MSESLTALENASEFVARHIGISPTDEARMLGVIGDIGDADPKKG